MAKFRLIFIVSLLLFLFAWLVPSTLVWNRNRVPAIRLPAEETLPAGNVYDEYARLVRELPNADKQAIRGNNANNTLPVTERAAIVEHNRALLEQFHTLIGKPCVVTQLEPGVNFTAALDYAFLAGLVGFEAEGQAKSSPGKALDTVIDGLTFCEDVIRGGAIIQLNAGAPSVSPLCRELSEFSSSLSATEADHGATRIKELLSKQYPLTGLYQKERLIHVRRLMKSVAPEASRLFRFQLPADGDAWNYLLKPKTEAITSLNEYLLKWCNEANKPVRGMTLPELPASVKELVGGDTLGAGNLGSVAILYRYRETRLHLVYAGLLLEKFHKQKGSYPESLSDLGTDPLLRDTFSGKPFVYRRTGNDFVLYSVGPNGKDDGNAPEPSMRGGMSMENKGDIAYKPKSIFTERHPR